ncbi:MAG: PAS domain-containing protein [Deltaproteobacteria bacterium]|nr:PAS domain-containing protein [Deltaproteobacteria bacterium]
MKRKYPRKITPAQMFHAISSPVPEGITVIDKDMRIIWVNPVAERWAGGLAEEKGLYCHDVYHEGNGICGGCPSVAAFKTGRPEKSLFHAYYIDGVRRDVELMAAPVFDENGKTVAVAEIARDITEKLELEKKFKENKDRLQAIFDGIGDGISVIDRNYNIIRVNKGLLKIFNRNDFSELIGRKCFAQYYRRDHACDNCPAVRTFTEGIPGRITNIQQRGVEKTVLDVSIFPIKNSNNMVEQAIEYFRDVTGMVKLEDQLLHAERLAGVGELAAGIAHELRNPLANISASVQFCRKKFKLDEGLERHLSIILRNSKNAGSIITDLLDFAKPGDMSFELGRIETAINRACALAKSQCAKQRVNLRKRVQKDLPPKMFDKRRLEGVFLNFILNAVDAMPGGGSLVVSAHLDHHAKEIVVAFKDTGDGISKDNMNRIFDPFFTTKASGVGLGLSIAHSVITHHKGRIEVRSEAGRGTEVTVRLPVFSNSMLQKD